MDAALRAIRDIWSDHARREEACELARQYVDAHPDMAESFADLSVEAFVLYVEAARRDGDDKAVWRSNVWAMSQPPIHITGAGS